MYKIALKILMGDTAKYLGLVFGVTFATLLMSQQVSIFIGLMARTASAIYAVSEADIWVMDQRVRYIEEVEPMRDVELYNVRGVPGVKWAVPFYKGLSTIRMPDGLTQQVQLIGVDDVSLVGICPKMVIGDKKSLRYPENAMMDQNGYFFTWPKQPVTVPRPLELNDHRLMLTSVCDVLPTFFTFPILYVSYDTALEITPPTRNKLPFVLVKAEAGQDLQELKKRIEQYTHLQALTQEEFAWRSIRYILERTGIPINFGITIVLGIIIGAAITAQTFYIFVIENLKQFGAMKAIGFTNGQLLRVVLIQATLVASIGYALGIGLTSLFFLATSELPATKGFILHWQVMAGTAVVVAIITLFSILFSLRKVFKLDPAIVFRG
ncbi:MAG: FtsX-like permease family protein [Rhodospirillales bacterium]|nr:FtsX-like permease family protein [Alphaproteobacteria bacterium]MCB1839076.1 FtsX-like permease family protein [Alphaproteobacteria bacterium]MCB9977120.1 FtsX-like permease family protein [Rhodospirillales bacterium]